MVSKSPLIILDGAHNPDGMTALSKTLQTLCDVKPVAIMGMLKDKDCDSAVKIVAPQFSKVITVGVDNPRTMTADELKVCLAPYCNDICTADSLTDALNLAKAEGKPIVICGSLYLASQIRPLLTEKQNI